MARRGPPLGPGQARACSSGSASFAAAGGARSRASAGCMIAHLLAEPQSTRLLEVWAARLSRRPRGTAGLAARRLPPRKMSSPLMASQRTLFLCLDPPTPARVYGCLNLPASASARSLGGRPCKRCRCLVLPPQLLGGTLLPCNVAGVLAAGQVGRRRATGAHRQGNNGRTQAGVGEGTQLPCKFAWPAAVSRLPRALLACGHYSACY